MQELIVPLTDRTLSVPYVDVTGASPGPHLTVVAGIHGTEYTSIAAVREFARGLDPAWICGRITAVPVVNLPAFWERSPFVVPLDGKNLNRSFPGDPAGTAAEVLAHHVTESFIRPTDYLLLGTVSGLLGDDRVEIRAPEPGVPLFITSSPAVTADGLLMGLARAPG